MRVLVVAEDPEVRAARAADLERAGHEACGTSDAAGVTARVHATRPDALLIAAPESTGALRLVLARARGAAEAPLPAVLLLDGGSLWLRAALPDDLAPVAAVPRTADAVAIGRALASLASGEASPPRGGVGEVTVEYATRRLSGPGGLASLTPSEAALLALLAVTPGAFVASEQIARTLWGTAVLDRHARGAIRTHVHTLRGKLSTAGFAGGVQSRPGVGYRLVLAEPGSAGG